MKDHLMMMKKAGLITSVFLLFFTTGALGANYYVDRAGTDRAGCGDEGYGADACATPGYVIETIGAARGDAINIDDGTYGQYGTWGGAKYVVKVDGTLSGSGYLTLKARNDNQVIFDLNDTGTSNGYGYGAVVVDTTGVKFEGINFTRVARGGARLATGTSTGPSNDIYFLRCKFYNIGTGNTGSLEGSTNFTGITGVNGSTGATSPILVDKCEFYNIGRSSISAKWDHAVYTTGNFTVTNSLVYDVRGSVFYGKYCTASGLQLYNNTISNANDTMNGVNDFIHETGCNSIRLANNIFINPPSGRVGSLDYGDTADDWFAYNNVTDLPDGGSADHTGILKCYPGTATCPSEGNNWGANSNNKTGVTFSGQITDMANRDFTLTGSGSDLVNKGNATYASSDDYTGTSRPQFSANDIGAYEFSESSSSESPPDAPSNVRIVSVIE